MVWFDVITYLLSLHDNISANSEALYEGPRGHQGQFQIPLKSIWDGAERFDIAHFISHTCNVRLGEVIIRVL